MSLATAPETSVDLANRLRPVLLHINRHLRREAHAQGISPGQISMLSAICDRPGIGVAELAAREGMSSPSVSVHLDRLEAAGFVTRLREEDGDRRRVGLTVTPKGSRVLRTVRSRRTAWLSSQLEALTEDQRQLLSAAVEPLRALVHRQ
ncbi:MAG: winged helix-turn-helix transcriptional regulator [Candidatus Dormibacteraeota bacterium]|nr:winged helix-turn-helix transcriptional regulator [Candidatus Dormibacteraeota bacterium]MBV8445663.1 winged helix-turn-helix transcriptional regulator [Candidatus Dormibacteraeota bacterium]